MLFVNDLYPTYMKDSKGFDDHHATVATIIGNFVFLFVSFLPSFTFHLLNVRHGLGTVPFKERSLIIVIV